MKIEQSTLCTLHLIMDDLSKGTDPTSGLAFPEDTLLNSKVLQHAFAESAKIFNAMIAVAKDGEGTIVGKKMCRKAPFYIFNSELDSILFFEEKVTISRLTYLINEKVKRNNMKKLRATQITSWLAETGYLEEFEDKNGIKYKIVTDKGRQIGIESIYKTNSRGNKYVTNLYSKSAQQFLVEDVLPKIITVI